MKKSGFLLLPLLAIALMLGIASQNAVAQNTVAQGGDNSVYFVTYYSNANTTISTDKKGQTVAAGAPDETVRIVNDGDTGGNLWASFYVFDDSQELQECCSCVVSPDGLLSESVNSELTANSLTGKTNTRGVIKVISSSVGDPTNNTPTAGLRGYSTHTQSLTSTTYSITETGFADSNLTSGEQSLLQHLCFYTIQLGSGAGICSCTPEDRDF